VFSQKLMSKHVRTPDDSLLVCEINPVWMQPRTKHNISDQPAIQCESNDGEMSETWRRIVRKNILGQKFDEVQTRPIHHLVTHANSIGLLTQETAGPRIGPFQDDVNQRNINQQCIAELGRSDSKVHIIHSIHPKKKMVVASADITCVPIILHSISF